MKHSFSQAFSNWSSMQLKISHSPNFCSICRQTASILVLRKAFQILGLFSLCRVDLIATNSILLSNSLELEERKAIFWAKVSRLLTQSRFHWVESLSKMTARICRLLEERMLWLILYLFYLRGILDWQRIMNSFFRQLQYDSSWAFERIVLTCWFLCSSISKDSTSVLSLNLHLESIMPILSFDIFLTLSCSLSKLIFLLLGDPQSCVEEVNLVSLVIQLNLLLRLWDTPLTYNSLISNIYFSPSRFVTLLVRHKIQRTHQKLRERRVVPCSQVFKCKGPSRCIVEYDK